MPSAAADAPGHPFRRIWIAVALLGALPLIGGPHSVGGRPAAADPPLQPGQSYRQARDALTRAGWSPRRRTTGVPCSAIVPDRRCQLYPELQSCSQTGPGFCRFEWTSPAGVPLAVITRGGDAAGNPGMLSTWFVLP